MNRLRVILIVGALALPDTASAEVSRQKTARVTHIERSLSALESVADEWLIDTYNYLSQVERNQCQAPLQSLTVRCLLEAARQNCRNQAISLQERCNHVSDVIVTTRLSERYFISKSTRFRIISTHANYRWAMLAELRRRYAALVTEMTMEYPSSRQDQDQTELAQAIDGYCLSVSKTRSLSWQHCTAAIIWFIGTSGRMDNLGEAQ